MRPAARDRGVEVPFGPHPVPSVPEGYLGPRGPLPPLARADRHGVGAPRVGSDPLVRQLIDLPALCVLHFYVSGVVGADVQKLTVVQAPPRSLHRAD